MDPAPNANSAPGFTRTLANNALQYCELDLPIEAITVAKQCVLDWFAVTLVGSTEKSAKIIAEEFLSLEGGACTVIGQKTRASVHNAALINGVASHALDYDDVNRMMTGHPTVAVFPAVLAVAEAECRTGQDAIVAFIAGYESACMVGSHVSPSHYANGFHSTGTLGAIGAAVAAGLLMKLDAESMEHAIGIAATQGAGLKAMFGSMAKPLHAGKAAANGVLAARLAARGFTAQPGALEADQGFISTLSNESPRPPIMIDPGSEIIHTLFKYHAACYLTHSSIDALSALIRKHSLARKDIVSVELHVPESHLKVCNISDPSCGLESKFSLKHVAAMVICKKDTSSLYAYSDENALEPELQRVRQMVTVIGDMPAGGAVRVSVLTISGLRYEIEHNTAVVDRDIRAQGDRISEKFRVLAGSVIGADKAERMLDEVGNLESISDWSKILGHAR